MQLIRCNSVPTYKSANAIFLDEALYFNTGLSIHILYLESKLHGIYNKYRIYKRNKRGKFFEEKKIISEDGVQ